MKTKKQTANGIKWCLMVLTAFLVMGERSAYGAACAMTLSNGNISFTWDINVPYRSYQFTITKPNGGTCNYAIGISAGQSGSFTARAAKDGTKELPYQVYSDNALTKVVKTGLVGTVAADFITGTIVGGPGQTATVTYYVLAPTTAISSPSLVPAGTYTDNVTVSIYDGTDPATNYTLNNSYNVTYTFTVAKTMNVSVVDSGGAYQESSVTRNINFGNLSQGLSSAFDLRVRTNAGFSVTFSSANNGNLKHTTPAKNSLVPYFFYLNGSILNLAGSSTVPVVGLSGSGTTGTSGNAYPIRVVIGSLTSSSILSGTHTDQITITATTTE